MKKCCRCKQVKPLSDFPMCRSERDGHQRRCRICCGVVDKALREKRKARRIIPIGPRRCGTCGIVKNPAEFHCDVTSADGHRTECKDCCRTKFAGIIPANKRCRRCKLTKTSDQFSRNPYKKIGLADWCKNCMAEYHRVYAKTERAKKLTRNRQLRYSYGIEPIEYDRLLCEQKGRCAICGREDTPKKRLAVDHDAASTKVRGLLCRQCNVAIGLLQHDPRILRRAIKYLGKASVKPIAKVTVNDSALMAQMGIEFADEGTYRST
jgi:hypothetical protein